MRLDTFLQQKGYFDSRNKSAEAIRRGEIMVNDKTVLKPSYEVDENCSCKIEYLFTENYVSLGGYKLKKALFDFKLNVNGWVVCDVGASTGGFTDCILQNGAKKVYSVDLNDGLLHPKLKANERVIPVIKNAKDLVITDFNDEIDMICADLSFISATQVLNVFYNILPNDGTVVLLIKPQFEQGKRVKLKHGIIKDEKQRYNACKEVYDYAVKTGFCVKGLTTAPVVKEKNVEYLILLKKTTDISVDFEKLFIK